MLKLARCALTVILMSQQLTHKRMAEDKGTSTSLAVLQQSFSGPLEVGAGKQNAHAGMLHSAGTPQVVTTTAFWLMGR